MKVEDLKNQPVNSTGNRSHVDSFMPPSLTYFGLVVCSNMSWLASWEPILEEVKKRLTC